MSQQKWWEITRGIGMTSSVPASSDVLQFWLKMTLPKEFNHIPMA